MRKRIVSLLLAVCMAASLLVLPAQAAGGETVTFSDVHDSSTALAVECLRLLGVLDGYQDGKTVMVGLSAPEQTTDAGDSVTAKQGQVRVSDGSNARKTFLPMLICTMP